MMTLYENTAGVLIHNMKALSKILDKAEKHCEARKIDKAVMLGLRLTPDMFDLTRQVQLVTDFAKVVGRGWQVWPTLPMPMRKPLLKVFRHASRNASTFCQTSTKRLSKGLNAAKLPSRLLAKTTPMLGQIYVNSYALPHFYFHMTTAYNILRQSGVELGKSDFLGRA